MFNAVTIEKWAALRRARGRSPQGIIAATREMLGLHPDPNRCYHMDSRGRPILKTPDGKAPSLNANHMSLQAMAIGVLEGSTPGRGDARFRQLFDPARRSARVMEEVAGIDPTTFSDINAFVGLASGLIEVTMLEKYNIAAHIALELVDIQPSKVIGSRKVIGIGRGGNQATDRKPGEQHPRATLGQKWVTVGDTSERALGIDLLKETVFSDLTGDVVDQASSIGEWVGLAQANLIYDAFLGITNTYTFNGTVYNTYQTVSGGAEANNNYVNAIVNPQTDTLTMFQLADKQIGLMTATPPPADHGQRIVVMPNLIVCSFARMKRMAALVGATQIRIGDGSGASGTSVAVYAPNPVAGSAISVVASPQLDKRVTDSDGLALAGDAADGLWFYGERGWLKYSQNWPLNVVAAPADSYMMLDQGIVATYFADERGIPYVAEARKNLKNLNA